MKKVQNIRSEPAQGQNTKKRRKKDQIPYVELDPAIVKLCREINEFPSSPATLWRSAPASGPTRSFSIPEAPGSGYVSSRTRNF
jgi:hypothetical protein